MSDALTAQFALLPEYLGRHIVLALTAIVAGMSISFPLSLLVLRVRWLRGPVLAVASAIQTVPSLALLALMVPLLGTIGFLPAVIALTLYSMLPVLRNTVTGIEDVDANLVEAGRGLGMTPRQLLFTVQIPLALPVIIAGVRTAIVWVVGIATLATPVGATSLGNYIFSGLQTRNLTAVVFGCVAAAALALGLDLVVRLLEVASMRRSRRMVAGVLVLLAVIVIGGVAPIAWRAARSDDRPVIVVGSKTFTEQYILAEMIAGRLEAAGFRARRLESLGSTVVFDALVAGRIDVYVDYTGTIWANHMGHDEPAPAEVVTAAVSDWLHREHGIEVLGELGFENAYALAMPRDRADALGIESIDDLVRYAPDFKIGGDYEFFARPEWERLRDAYGLDFADMVSMDGSLMYSAVAAEQIDVIAAFSTDGRIAARDLVVLDDPRDAFPPYDAVLLLGPRAAARPGLRAALEPLIGAISDDAMRDANRRVDLDGADVEDTARGLRP